MHLFVRTCWTTLLYVGLYWLVCYLEYTHVDTTYANHTSNLTKHKNNIESVIAISLICIWKISSFFYESLHTAIRESWVAYIEQSQTMKKLYDNHD